MSLFHRTVSVVLAMALLVSGCTRFDDHTHVRYEVGAEEKIRPAKEGGLYQVEWSATPDGPRKPLAASSRIVMQGDPIGFRTDRGGRVAAMTAGNWFALDRLPSNARYCVWTVKVPKAHPAGQDIDAGRIAGGILVVALVAAIEVGLAALDEACDPPTHHERDHRDNHHKPTHP